MTDKDNIIEKILLDNESYVQSHDVGYFLAHAHGQSPQITMLTCSDSRVSTQVIVHDPVNRVFIIKNIGNQIATSEGSIDYGIYHLKTPVFIIVGHTDCGAIKARMKGFRGEHASIRRELVTLPASFSDPLQSVDYNRLVLDNVLENIHYQVRRAASKYTDLVDNSDLLILGAYYDFRNDLGKGYGRLVIISRNGLAVDG